MKMKKSKIIVPALGLLLLSTAASVSGTVAWFTATNTYDLSASNFKVTKLDGDLACTLAAGVGTTVDNNAHSVSIDNTAVEMVDASFNHTTGMLYTDTMVANTYKEIANVSSVSSAAPGAWRVGETKKYYAVSWTMTFEFEYVADFTQMNLYLDITGGAGEQSSITGTQHTAAQNSSTKESWKGFRVAFYGTTATKSYKKVYAGGQAISGCQYVSSTSALGAYTATDLIATDTTGVADTAANGAATAANCLGYFSAAAAGTQTLAFTCVAWFEGTDTNIENDTRMDNVAASLKFFVRPNA